LRWSPHVAVVTMISADHLDWHGSAAAYINAKRNIVRFQKPADFAALNSENSAAASFGSDTAATVISFNAKSHPAFNLKLAGAHNQLNAQAAFAAAQIFDVDWGAAQAAIADFNGLPHRLQLVHEENGIRYINDSIATIPEAAIAALTSFPVRKVIQIVGGSGKKNLPTRPLCRALATQAKAVLCIGETAESIESQLPMELAQNCVDLATAVQYAKKIAVPGDIVLLSPGHPSYDQFTNFEARGTEFTRLARQ
jgi:UDP-N-acetylmuramoylalanine--D-glutamate ligase